MAIDLFARGGLRILERIEGIGYRVWSRRPVITKWDVAGLTLGAVGRSWCRRFRFRRPASSPGAEINVTGAESASGAEAATMEETIG